MASDKGEVVLADVAKRKANEMDTQAITGTGKKTFQCPTRDTKCDRRETHV